MKSVIATLIIVAVLGFGWWYIHGINAEKNIGTNTEKVIGMPADGLPVEEMVVNVDANTADIKIDDTPAPVEVPRIFSVTGKNFEFSQKEIRVKMGDTVTINFEATSGFHDWNIDEFKARTQQVRPGTKTSVTFVADKKGAFEYYCSVGEHRAMGMVGKLIVE